MAKTSTWRQQEQELVARWQAATERHRLAHQELATCAQAQGMPNDALVEKVRAASAELERALAAERKADATRDASQSLEGEKDSGVGRRFGEPDTPAPKLNLVLMPAGDLARHVGEYVDKLANGAQPGDLPVQEPTTFELVISLKAAKALGLTMPRSLLVRADQIIE